jgi:2-oxoglutarate ferredoxin oxidoreductase subunit delta
MPKKGNFHVYINRGYCKKCGICSWICPTGTIIEDESGKPEVTDHKTCIGCLMCERSCPDFAIDIQEIEVKENV